MNNKPAPLKKEPKQDVYEDTAEDVDNGLDILEDDVVDSEISQDRLEECWLNFADKFKKARPRMYTTLKKQLPTLLNENVVEVSMNNSAQQEDFNARVRNDLQAYLKKELNNSTLEIVTKQVDEQNNNNGKIYTPEDKFEHMSKKNPNLLKLRQEFNLDFE